LNDPHGTPPSDSVAAGFRPTLFLGLGGAAARVLLHLRQRLKRVSAERTGLPGLQFLLFDTDRTALRLAEAGDDGDGLAAGEMHALPLRKPAEYRSSADEILSWLSRRWLYNIPRSLLTEGLRPLGRLAFIDHRQAIGERIRAAIGETVRPDSLSLTSQTLALPVRQQSPQVFVITSIGGGTGSGMLLDVAYAVRQQLEELGLPAESVRGMMLHATLARSAANDLRKTNAYATLTELSHFMQGGAAYRTGPVEVLPAGDVSEPPFSDAYLVNLGEELSDADFDDATQQVAEYLYLDAATACGAALDDLRRSQRAAAGTKQDAPRLRTFGLSSVRFDRFALAQREAEQLCLQLAQQWLGEAHDDQRPEFRIKPPDFQLDELLTRLQGVADQALGGSADAHFRSLVIGDAGRPAIVGDDDPAGPFGEELRRIHAVLGLPTQFDPGQAARPTRFEASLRDAADKLAAGMASSLIESISQLVEAPRARLPAAIAAGSLFHEHVRNLRQAAEAVYQQDQADAAALWSRLQRGDLPGERFGWFGRFTASNDPEEHLLRYCRLRLGATLHKQVSTLLEGIAHKLAALNDQLFKLRQSVEWLVAEFATAAATYENQPDAAGIYGSALGDELERVRQPDYVAQFEQSLRDEWLASQGGLLGLAPRSAEEWHALRDQLLEHARRTVADSLAGLNAGQLLLKVCPSGEKLAGALTGAAEQAAPRLNRLECVDHLLVVVPRGPSCGEVVDAVRHGLKPSTVVVGDEGDLVFCREAGGLSLAQAAAAMVEDRGDCAEAARRVLTRVDVPWATLATDVAVRA